MTTEMRTIDVKAYARKKRRKKLSEAGETFARIFRTPSAKIGGIILSIIILLAIFAPLIAPYDPFEIHLKDRYSAPSSKYIFGTDELGRDLFSRILHGAKYSLFLGISAAVLGHLIGVILGTVAGYFGGAVETIIMRFCDIWAAIPGLLLTIIMSAILGPGYVNTIIAMSIGDIPGSCRMIRGQILAERSKEYLLAAEAMNCSKLSIMFKHMMPNVISPVIVGLTMAIGRTITSAASLSYLGLGVQPPIPEWGALISAGKTYLSNYPFLIIFPGIAIAITVYAVNLIGDGVRDAMDPKLRG